jgi:hypothetical protein
VPDPNFFGGVVEVCEGRGEWVAHDTVSMPLGKFNHQMGGVGPMLAANYRMLGVTEMASAIQAGRAPRASGRLAQHALDVMEAILQAGATGRVVDVTGGTRPAALTAKDVSALLVDPKAVTG